MKKMKVKLSQLQTNTQLTGIRPVDDHTVNKYRQAYKAGAKFPDIIVEHDTLMVVSGNHRLAAMKAVFGNDYETTAIAKQYTTKADLLKDFAKENHTHGRPMDGFTQKKLFRAMINEGMNAAEIGEMLKIPVKNIKKLTEQVVSVQIGVNEFEDMPVKQGFKSDKPITEQQYEDHVSKDRPWPVTSIAEQLTRWLAGNTISPSSTAIAALKKLKEVLDKYLTTIEREKEALLTKN